MGFLTVFRALAKKTWLWAVIILCLANIVLFWQFYGRGLLPFPGDLLVSFFFPWQSGGFAGFDPWTTHKDVIAADAVRQMYPWKSLVVDQLKRGEIPLWSPFDFSGTPLLANLQSSVFSPLNLLLLFFPLLPGWIGLVVGLPLLYSVFTYFFLRELSIKQLPAIFGGIVAANISYFLVWAEQLVIIQTALFLPLSLWAIDKYVKERRLIYLVLVSFLLAFSIFGGHIQTAVYVFLITIAYALFREVPKKLVAIFLFLAVGIAAVQLLPSAELYSFSAREGAQTRRLFLGSVLPWQNLITILAADFFGNPAVKNFWGRDYGNFQVYFGVVALLLGVLAVTEKRSKEIWFFFILGIFGLLFALPPLAYLLSVLRLPILSSGVAARAVFIFQMAMAVLAAYGANAWLEEKGKVSDRFRVAVAVIGAIYAGGFLWAIISKNPALLVSAKNLVLPASIFFLTAVALLFATRVSKVFDIRLLLCLFLVLALFEYTYFLNKYQPFSKREFVFPDHPVTKFLQEISGINRYFGFGTAYIDSNFATYYKIFSPEGYDSLYIRHYGELLASTYDGWLPSQILRSDAVFTSTETKFRERLFDLLGVKYILDKNDEPKTNWEPEFDKFPREKYELVWQQYKWKAYERKTVLPRVFLAGEFLVETDQQKIIERIYEPTVDLGKTLILERDPGQSFETGGREWAEVVSYQPNRVEIETEADGAKLLFLSDAYYPGWVARVDGRETPVFRADYAFRALIVGAGRHKVVFEYEPLSFRAGAAVTASAVLLTIFLIKKKDETG